jgi:hypothetical protein
MKWVTSYRGAEIAISVGSFDEEMATGSYEIWFSDPAVALKFASYTGAAQATRSGVKVWIPPGADRMERASDAMLALAKREIDAALDA